MRAALFLLLGVAGLALVLAGGACTGIEADTLFALRLPGPPGEDDWASAVPLRVMAGGGAVHRDLKPLTVQEVDRDTIHRTSASCHHGPSTRTLFPVWLRAFYDADNLYLRLSWPDLTPDVKGREWVLGERGWRLEGNGGDGIALVFPLERSGGFTCALICHLDDYTVFEGAFQEAARMHYRESGLADVWLWRADERKTHDLFVDARGIHPDGSNGPYRLENSLVAERRGREGAVLSLILGPGDEPARLADGRRVPDRGGLTPGSRAPAYLPLPAGGGEGTIESAARYAEGLWEVTLVKPRSGASGHDVDFRSGETYPFGLSVLDDTVRDHHIVETSWMMKLLS